MKQSTSRPDEHRLHVAIIMDGNGRWASARGWPRIAGHRAGGEAVRRIVEAAPDHGVGTLSLYAFSADNWRRPRPEVAALMQLLGDYLRDEVARCVREGVRLSFIGRRDRLPRGLVRGIEAAESATAAGRTLHLRLAVDYSAREAILETARRLNGNGATREAFGRMLAEDGRTDPREGDVDLLIRTGGERRLSDFLLWECAYAELYFTSIMWPDFGARDLADAIRDYHARERRFGGLPKQAAG
jgi:undecaprenyl diphosphate synthase